MTKINKEYTLQTFKASASNTSQFLENKGYKIPQTTLLHALSVFVGEKNWNTLQSILKEKPQEKKISDNTFPKEIAEIIRDLIDNLEKEEEIESTLLFIKNRLQEISNRVSSEVEEYRDFISNIKNKHVYQFYPLQWNCDIVNHILNKYDFFYNNIYENPNYFFEQYNDQEQHRTQFFSNYIDKRSLSSNSKNSEICMNVLLSFNIFCLYEIQKEFFQNLTYYVDKNINNESLLDYKIHISYFECECQEMPMFLKIDFLNKFLGDFN